MADAAAMTARRVWHLESLDDPSGQRLRHTIYTFPFRIGRRSDQSLCLTNPSVSKCHCELRDEGGRLVAADLASTNGTFLNGERISGSRIVNPGDILQFGECAYSLRQEAERDDNATCVQSALNELAAATMSFHRMMRDQSLEPHYQRIVKLHDAERTMGYEVLARSSHEGLRTPKELFSVARKLDLEIPLSQMSRFVGTRDGQRLVGTPEIFFNTHPSELHDATLIESLVALRQTYPSTSLTLEVHEESITDSSKMRDLSIALANLDIRLAYDDFGAGQARLHELAECPPDYVKFDMKLIRGIHSASSQRQKMLETLVRMTLDLGIAPLAEGIEVQAEAEICSQLGFTHAQGFYFGMPQPVTALQCKDPKHADWFLRTALITSSVATSRCGYQ